MKRFAVIACILASVAFATFSSAQFKPAAVESNRWEYATLGTIDYPSLGVYSAAWKVPDKEVVQAENKISLDGAITELTTKLIGKAPSSGYPACMETQILNYAGASGWELTAKTSDTHSNGTHAIYIFKRPAR